MAYYLYILQSQTTGNLYIGQTNDLDDRVLRHNTGQNKSTKGRGPWVLIFSKQFDTRAEAMQLEKQMKSWKNPQKVKAWMQAQG